MKYLQYQKRDPMSIIALPASKLHRYTPLSVSEQFLLKSTDLTLLDDFHLDDKHCTLYPTKFGYCSQKDCLNIDCNFDELTPFEINDTTNDIIVPQNPWQVEYILENEQRLIYFDFSQWGIFGEMCNNIQKSIKAEFSLNLAVSMICNQDKIDIIQIFRRFIYKLYSFIKKTIKAPAYCDNFLDSSKLMNWMLDSYRKRFTLIEAANPFQNAVLMSNKLNSKFSSMNMLHIRTLSYEVDIFFKSRNSNGCGHPTLFKKLVSGSGFKTDRMSKLNLEFKSTPVKKFSSSGNPAFRDSFSHKLGSIFYVTAGVSGLNSRIVIIAIDDKDNTIEIWRQNFVNDDYISSEWRICASMAVEGRVVWMQLSPYRGEIACVITKYYINIVQLKESSNNIDDCGLISTSYLWSEYLSASWISSEGVAVLLSCGLVKLYSRQKDGTWNFNHQIQIFSITDTSPFAKICYSRRNKVLYAYSGRRKFLCLDMNRKNYSGLLNRAKVVSLNFNDLDDCNHKLSTFSIDDTDEKCYIALAFRKKNYVKVFHHYAKIEKKNPNHVSFVTTIFSQYPNIVPFGVEFLPRIDDHHHSKLIISWGIKRSQQDHHYFPLNYTFHVIKSPLRSYNPVSVDCVKPCGWQQNSTPQNHFDK